MTFLEVTLPGSGGAKDWNASSPDSKSICSLLLLQGNRQGQAELSSPSRVFFFFFSSAVGLFFPFQQCSLQNPCLSQSFIYLFFWLHQVAREILVPGSQIEPVPCACGILTTGPSEFLFSMLPSSPASQESFLITSSSSPSREAPNVLDASRSVPLESLFFYFLLPKVQQAFTDITRNWFPRCLQQLSLLLLYH